MRILKGRFTNREIVVGGIILGTSWFIVDFHWLGFVTGIPLAAFVVWLTRRTINSWGRSNEKAT